MKAYILNRVNRQNCLPFHTNEKHKARGKDRKEGRGIFKTFTSPQN